MSIEENNKISGIKLVSLYSTIVNLVDTPLLVNKSA